MKITCWCSTPEQPCETCTIAPKRPAGCTHRIIFTGLYNKDEDMKRCNGLAVSCAIEDDDVEGALE